MEVSQKALYQIKTLALKKDELYTVDETFLGETWCYIIYYDLPNN